MFGKSSKTPLLVCLYNKRTLHVSSKIRILCSRGKSNISRLSAANEWDIYCSCHSNIKFISSRHRAISSFIYLDQFTQHWMQISSVTKRLSFLHLFHLTSFVFKQYSLNTFGEFWMFLGSRRVRRGRKEFLVSTKQKNSEGKEIRTGQRRLPHLIWAHREHVLRLRCFPHYHWPTKMRFKRKTFVVCKYLRVGIEII